MRMSVVRGLETIAEGTEVSLDSSNGIMKSHNRKITVGTPVEWRTRFLDLITPLACRKLGAPLEPKETELTKGKRGLRLQRNWERRKPIVTVGGKGWRSLGEKGKSNGTRGDRGRMAPNIKVSLSLRLAAPADPGEGWEFQNGGRGAQLRFPGSGSRDRSLFHIFQGKFRATGTRIFRFKGCLIPG